MIVCEGKKTEVNYFEEIRQKLRLPSVHLTVVHSDLGTEPELIVHSAEKEFSKTKAYDVIFAVFDRDEHLTYANAIAMADARNRKIKNDDKDEVGFEAVVTVPCFELWLLIHFENILAPLHRDEALARLKEKMKSYEKGCEGVFSQTALLLPKAIERARALKQNNSRLPGTEPYTDVHDLVAMLLKFSNNIRTVN